MNDNSSCFLCGSDKVHDFFQLPPMPTMDGVMCSTAEEAQNVTKGRISLRFCKNCGYIGNEEHEEDKVNFDEYDFSNDHSPIYTKFTEELSDRLINRYNLKGKTILDIGCGDGDFLKTICKRGNNKGIGVDPGFDYSKKKSNNGVDLTFIREYYSEKHKDIKADLVVSRLVLTLPNDPVTFIKTIRKNLEDQPDTIVYFDIPNSQYTFEEKVVWNVIYEHRSWYSKESLSYLLELCGFEVLSVDLCWHDEFLSIEARPNTKGTPPQLPDPSRIGLLEGVIKEFADGFAALKMDYQQKIDTIKASGKKAMAWSAGARALTFFNIYDLKKDVPYIVDINVNRQGKFLPGSGQPIVAPEFAIEYQPDIIIITNPTYADEIKDHVKQMGLKPEFWVL
ncbi:MAG: SAM-dependent methyltransferase [Saprospiraceae bacterium]|jgi:SAM-dependent methyltransferase